MDRVVIYGDDIAIAAAGATEAQTLKQALAAKLALHPAGPFQLKSCEVMHATDGFNFLKYKHTFHPHTGEVRLRPSRFCYERYRKRVVALSLYSSPESLPRRLAAYRRDWMKAFPRWKWNQTSKHYLYDTTVDAVALGLKLKNAKKPTG